MYIINGGKKLSGSVRISGSKNACLPLLAASLLIRGKVTLTSVPHILDVNNMIELIKSLGVTCIVEGDKLYIDSTNLSLENFQSDKIKKLRASILLISPILQYFDELKISQPGGCSIGKRPIDSHLNGLESIGYKCKVNDDYIAITGKKDSGDRILDAGFSVTSTENLIIANVLRKGTTMIKLAAIEPHVICLIDFFNKAGANIRVDNSHNIVISGVKKLKDNFEFEVIGDYIESGTFMIIGALLSEKYIDIENARIGDLYAFIEKLKEAGIKLEDRGNDVMRVYKTRKIRPVSIQTNIFPGFPTDLQSPFTILMMFSDGVSKIHEILFESRLNFLVEVEKVGGNVAILNPHEAMIFGKNKYKSGATLTSWDLRAGIAMVVLALKIKGETKVTNIDYIKRGYDNFLEKIQSLGGDVREEDE